MNEKSMKHQIHERSQFIRNAITAGLVAIELSHENTPIIDEQFINIATREADQDGALFSVLDLHLLHPDRRPDAIRHTKTLLPPNPISGQEVTKTLSLVDMMLGEQVPEIQSIFSDEIRNINLFEHMKATPEKAGGKFIIVSNHLQLSDQGFTLGFLHKVALEHGIDRLEHHLTAVIGRAIGYFQFGELNAVDDILRKVGSVLKTFPSSGSEALTEDEQQSLMIFRGICNHFTKQAFSELITSRTGRIICMAPSGEQDKFNAEREVVTMSSFGKGTSELMIEACEQDALIIPVYVDYGNDASIVKFLEPRSVSSIEDCHQVGQDIAATGTYARGEATGKYPQIKRFHYPVTYK